MPLRRPHLAFALFACGLAACGGSSSTGPLTGPEKLSETGLYADFAARRLSNGIIPLHPRYPLWSDGAEKQRYLLLPRGAQIDTTDMDAWRFPVGTKVWKEFKLDGQLVETRLLEKRRDPDEGGWFQMAYAWNDDQSEAMAAPAGVQGAHGTTYEIPKQADCSSCHYKGEKPIIGISALQLSTSADPAQPPTIDTLVQANALSTPPSATYAPPGDSVVQPALGYLFGNCSYCHDSRSAAAADVKVFMNLSVDDTVPENTLAYRTLVGQPIHHFPDVGLLGEVVPGNPDKSLVHYRMDRRDAAQMPPIITHEVDDVGVATISAWIQSLPVP